MDRQRENFVRNQVELGRRQIRAGEAGGPFAFMVPAEQRDPGSAAELLRVLRRGGGGDPRALTADPIEGRAYPAGSWVVMMAQPYRAHAKDLLERQQYPGASALPRRAAGAALRSRGLDAAAADGRGGGRGPGAVRHGGLSRVDSVRAVPGTVTRTEDGTRSRMRWTRG
jgi:hypothetical protein